MTPPALPLILAGPIVRKATPSEVWFWLACSQEIRGCAPRIVPLAPDGSIWTHLVDEDLKEIVLRVGDLRRERLGQNLWIVLVSAVPTPGQLFPTDIVLGYDLLLSLEEQGVTKTTKLSQLGLGIHYPPYSLPTFVVGKLNSRLATGSCRRPGARGEDAHNVFDEHLAATASDAFARPSSLILSGDQIYADDVAVPLFEAVRKIAADVFGYVERMPKGDGSGLASVDGYSWGAAMEPGAGTGSRSSAQDRLSGRRILTHRLTSPIGFSTEDGECHLLSLAEYAAMYLVVWGPELAITYNVDDGRNEYLKGFVRSVQSTRRVMANVATYMLFDDHDVTDDWNLDERWETRTRSNPMARRIIANALAAYWAFQAWGNEPALFDDDFREALRKHVERLRIGRGVPGPTAYAFEKLLLETHWSFVAASNPAAVCVDTRTRREYPRGKGAILSGKRVQPYIAALLRQHGLPKGGLLLLVLPTPLLSHRSILTGQGLEYDLPGQAYEADFEFYGNNAEQRAQIVYWLKQSVDPKAIVILSGDVHHGSVVTGRYAGGRDLDVMRGGAPDWVVRVVQVTSSPIKNVNATLLEWGNYAESLVPQVELQHTTEAGAGIVAMQAAVRDLKGPLGRRTFVFENHFCVVDMPDQAGGPVGITFVGVKDGKSRTATITVDTDNDRARFKFIKTSLPSLPYLPPRD